MTKYEDNFQPYHETAIPKEVPERLAVGNPARTEVRRPIGVDLFAGVGGLSLGFEQAGFDVKAAVEIDPVHCGVYAHNFPATSVICASVEALSGADIRIRAGLGEEEIDCVFGGAPSQGFTSMGKRELDNPNNMLGLHFVRLVKELGARSFVFDNVKGITQGAHRGYLDMLVAEFIKVGYEVRTDWQILNACHFKVPQSREHFVLLGARRGERIPAYPDPKCNASGRPTRWAHLPVGPTVADALEDLPDAESFDSLKAGDTIRLSQWNDVSDYASGLRATTAACWHFGYPRAFDPLLLTSSARTEHSEITRRRFAETSRGGVEPISHFTKLDPDGIAPTLRAGTDGQRGAFSSPRPIHYRFDRCITVREMARLHGFPDWFRFHTTKWHGGRQVGLAVPPPLARAIGNRVLEALSATQSRPSTSFAEQNEALLQHAATKAAQHFDVTLASSKRDRKGTPSKRKQVDIEAARLGQSSATAAKAGSEANNQGT